MEANEHFPMERNSDELRSFLKSQTSIETRLEILQKQDQLGKKEFPLLVFC